MAASRLLSVSAGGCRPPHPPQGRLEWGSAPCRLPAWMVPGRLRRVGVRGLLWVFDADDTYGTALTGTRMHGCVIIFELVHGLICFNYTPYCFMCTDLARDRQSFDLTRLRWRESLRRPRRSRRPRHPIWPYRPLVCLVYHCLSLSCRC